MSKKLNYKKIESENKLNILELFIKCFFVKKLDFCLFKSLSGVGSVTKLF